MPMIDNQINAAEVGHSLHRPLTGGLSHQRRELEENNIPARRLRGFMGSGLLLSGGHFPFFCLSGQLQGSDGAHVF
jgi:hypothetical protein